MHIEYDHWQEKYCSVSEVLLKIEFSGLNVDVVRFEFLNRTQIGRKRSLRSGRI